MPRVTPEQRAATRQAIVEAASGCLADLGFDRTTTRAIAARAGIANGLIYRYFDGKEALFAAVADHQARSRTPDLLARVGDSDGRAGLSAVIASLFDGSSVSTSALPALRAAAAKDESVRQALRRYDRNVVDLTAPLLAAAEDSGALALDDREATVEAIQALFEGVQARLASGTVTTSATRLAAAARALVASLVQADGT